MASRWVIASNIKHFKDKLTSEGDAAKRQVLEELLSKEEQKLRDFDDQAAQRASQ